jgi:EAL domain-containing protein (putative c-di-GMP-specific phosphodiesterase class I)
MSGALVGDAGFARRAADIVEPARGKVSFEITETAVIADPERAIANLEMWTEAGIELAIDDYGTGVSSLAYLKTLPARERKLDRSFIHQIATSGRDRLLVKSTIDLAHNLGMEITAEGVEDEEGLNVLRLLGCDMAQGFGLCRPVDHAATVAFLKKQAEANAQSNARQSSPAQTEQARRVR